MGEVKPQWIRVSVSAGGQKEAGALAWVLKEHSLRTVCQSARCPNLPQCWGERTATFLLLGDVCTRHCGFCAVNTGWPRGEVDADEPRRVAEAASELGLHYVVLTSVDRDDLPDGGAGQFAAAVEAIRAGVPQARVEVLIPDYGPGQLDPLLAEGPVVVGHNVETVRRLTPVVRDDRAGYERSLSVLAETKRLSPDQPTKSSLLLGMGEEQWEVEETLADLREVGTDIVVLGQYLRPTARQLPVARYVPPEEFASLAGRARSLGFRGVVATPLARSSFGAARLYREMG